MCIQNRHKTKRMQLRSGISLYLDGVQLIIRYYIHACVRLIASCAPFVGKDTDEDVHADCSALLTTVDNAVIFADSAADRSHVRHLQLEIAFENRQYSAVVLQLLVSNNRSLVAIGLISNIFQPRIRFVVLVPCSFSGVTEATGGPWTY